MARPNSITSIVKPWMVKYYRANGTLPTPSMVLENFKDHPRVTSKNRSMLSTLKSNMEAKLREDPKCFDEIDIKIQPISPEKLKQCESELERTVQNRLHEVRQLVDRTTEAAQNGHLDAHAYEKLVKLEAALAKDADKIKSSKGNTKVDVAALSMEEAMRRARK